MERHHCEAWQDKPVSRLILSYETHANIPRLEE